MIHYTITTYGSDEQILNIDEMGMAYHYLEIKVELLLQIFTNLRRIHNKIAGAT